MEPDVEATIEQPENSPTIPRSSKYNFTTCVITRSLTAMTTIYISLSAELIWSRNAHVDVAENRRRAMWHIRGSSHVSHILFWIFPGD